MAEEEGATKGLSARGAFFIGLVLGGGLGVLTCMFQTMKLTNEINRLNGEKMLVTKQLMDARGRIAAAKK